MISTEGNASLTGHPSRRAIRAVTLVAVSTFAVAIPVSAFAAEPSHDHAARATSGAHADAGHRWPARRHAPSAANTSPAAVAVSAVSSGHRTLTVQLATSQS